RAVPDARLLLVGDGPQAAALRAQAEALGIADAVEMTGAVAPVDVPGHLHRMDVATAPYPAVGEGYFSPLKVYEYMAAGLPVVASAVGQLPRVVDHRRTGFLVPGSDPAALAEALRELAVDRRLRARVGAPAREHAVAGHTSPHVVARSLAAAGMLLSVPPVAAGESSALGDSSALAEAGAAGGSAAGGTWAWGAGTGKGAVARWRSSSRRPTSGPSCPRRGGSGASCDPTCGRTAGSSSAASSRSSPRSPSGCSSPGR